MALGLEHLSCEERLREVKLFSQEKAPRNLTNAYKYLKARSKKDGAVHLPVVPRASSNEHSLEHKKFPLNTRQHFCAVRVTEHWHRLPRSSSLETFRSHLDMGLGILLWVAHLDQLLLLLHGKECACLAGVVSALPRGLFTPHLFGDAVIHLNGPLLSPWLSDIPIFMVPGHSFVSCSQGQKGRLSNWTGRKRNNIDI